MEAKQDHVRLVKSLLIPFSFLPSASYPVYAFWSSYSSVIDLGGAPIGLMVELSALWCRRLQARLSSLSGPSALLHVDEFVKLSKIPLSISTLIT